MTASIVARHANLQRYGSGDISATLVGTGTDKLIAVVATTRSGAPTVLTSCAIGAESATVVDNFVATGDTGSLTSIAIFTNSQHPGAGAATFTFTWASAADISIPDGAIIYMPATTIKLVSGKAILYKGNPAANLT